MKEQDFSFTAAKDLDWVHTISVFNLRGGVGKTTLATNLAIAFLQLTHKEVGVMDIAQDTLHCSWMLDVKPKAYLSGLADLQEKGITNDLMEELLTKHSSGVNLLAAAENPKEAELVSPVMVTLAWQKMTDRFGYIIIDAGSSFNEISLAAIDRSDLIILVFSPELASVKSTTDAAQILVEIGIPTNKLIAVANWIFPPTPLFLQRIKPLLKVDLAAEIPYDSLNFGKAINTGRPLLVDNPACAAAEEIRSLAKKINEICAQIQH